MTSSLKIGAISGLIAGFVSGTIIILFAVPFFVNIFGTYWWVPPPPVTPIWLIALLDLGYGLIFGVILGVFYSKAYSVIPGKGTLKAVFFGLFLYAMLNLRFATIDAAYGRNVTALAGILYGFFIWVPFIVVLGPLYESLKRKYSVSEGPKIIEYNMREAFHPAAIAGLLGGTATFITIVAATSLGFWQFIPDQLANVSFLVVQLGGQTFFHLIWCAVFGLVFAKVYNLVPSKGVMKGLVYGLIGFLITEGRYLGYGFVLGYASKSEFLIFAAKQMVLLGLTVWIVFGLVLGALYRKQ